MSDEFKIGDVVKLKSGGPKMTVEDISDVRSVKVILCSWFDKSNRFNDEFDQRLLEHFKHAVGSIGVFRS